MKNKRIGLMHYSYPPVIGGVEKVVFDHAQLFAEYGYNVTIFSGDGENKNNDIKLNIIPELKSLRLFDAVLYQQIIDSETYPELFFNWSNTILKKLTKQIQDIDILIIHNILTMTLNLPLNKALLELMEQNPHKKFISWTHDVALNNDKKKKVFKNIKIYDLIYKQNKNIQYIGISNYLKETLIKEIGFNQNSIKIIPNGIDLASFLEINPLSKQIMAKRKIDMYDFVIYYPGKIIKYKNIDYCLNIINQIKNQGKNPILVISAGKLPHTNDPEYFNEIKDMVIRLDLQKNILFLDDEIDLQDKNISFKIVKDFYKISDVVFNLSSFENFGLPLIEAGIYKTPLIVNDLTVFKEIIKDNTPFIDINSDSPTLVASKIIEILKNNPQSKLFNKIKKNYNLENIFKNQIEPLVNY